MEMPKLGKYVYLCVDDFQDYFLKGHYGLDEISYIQIIITYT